MVDLIFHSDGAGPLTLNCGGETGGGNGWAKWPSATQLLSPAPYLPGWVVVKTVYRCGNAATWGVPSPALTSRSDPMRLIVNYHDDQKSVTYRDVSRVEVRFGVLEFSYTETCKTCHRRQFKVEQVTRRHHFVVFDK
jgi:hypothetical protein